MKVLVAGGGIAGLTVASALAQKGAEVDLIERKPTLSDGGGVGLSLVANAMRALDTIGVAQACVDAGVPADSLAMCRPDGALLVDNPLPRIGGPRWPGATGIARAALHAILSRAATDAGVRVACDVAMHDWDDDDTGVQVTFTDGRVARYDVIVAADGLYSATRARLMPGVGPQYTGQAVWRAKTPRPAGLDRTTIHLGGRHGVVGICPVAADLAYVYIVEAAPENLRRDEATLHDQLREKLEGYGGMVPAVAATLTSPDLVSYRPLEWILVPGPWNKGRIVLIGDAVHANPPVLAQGAAMAIEDAVVLAEELATPAPVGLAFARFMERRLPRATAIVTASCELARAEVEQRHDLDVPGIMRSTSQMLAAPL